MKKVLLSAIALCAALTASAERTISLVPLTVNPGDNNVNAVINLECDGLDVCDLTFEVWLPEGFTFVGSGRSGKTWEEGVTTKLDAGRTQYMFTKGQGLWSGSINSNTRGYYLKVGGVGGNDEAYIEGYNGKFMDLYINVASTVAPGVYPVKFMNCDYNSFKQKEVKGATYVSYIVVGNPAAQALTFEAGELASAVNAALATETRISTLDLSAVTALNGDFTYVDKRNVVAPADVTASVKYEGNKTGYYSVNVPFGGAVTGEVYELTSTTDKYAHFDPVTEVEAGKTYLAEGAVTIAANAKVASVAEQTNQTGNYVLDDTFYHGSNLTVPATRGLFEGASLSNLRVVVDGVLTNINVAQIEAAENAYDLQGRQTNNAKNGVFVVNGKKQFVK